MRLGEFKRQGKVLRSAVGLFAFVCAGGTLAWMFLAPDLLKAEIEKRTGFPLEVETLGCNPFGISLTGRNLVVGNPESFGEPSPFLEIAKLDARLDLGAYGRGEIWIHELDLTIPRATLVVDERGNLNLDAFASRLFARAEGEGQKPFYAERVRLKVDELVFVDNSGIVPRREPPLRVVLDVELNDLDSPRKLFAPMRKLAASVGSLPVR